MNTAKVTPPAINHPPGDTAGLRRTAPVEPKVRLWRNGRRICATPRSGAPLSMFLARHTGDL
ncbi:hypothetical protein J7443_10625 [Tropicibacter sp. R15_0]|uniref:hypothetical protein n=1 Tax=Tropicibacter sp. R15_0 TaxID=2821101 RepID=UPI001ADA6184|nr:hypothetical protein [Tropicibacter sp. R15_0]MBO9465683.1 hypothetical protein [Tropicibacter sp. R15_0]